MARKKLVEIMILSPRVKTKAGIRRMHSLEQVQYEVLMNNVSKQCTPEIALMMNEYNINGHMAGGASCQSETTADHV